MDSTIRDGGNVNDWNFGKRTIDGIIRNLIDSKIDIVELGYLKNGSFNIEKTLYDKISQAKKNIPNDIGNAEFSLMVQVDKWDWNKLEKCDGTIKHIRVSFHKIRIEEGLELCRKVIRMGYICHCNPINIMGYTDMELLTLIRMVNEVKPYCFTLVDTFGSMYLDDIRRIDALIDNNLDKDILVAAHLHENLGLAFSLAQEFVDFFSTRRDVFIDASLNGMGRVPGNLCQELIMDHLIQGRKAQYNIDPVYDAIDDFVLSIKSNNPWGYAVPYALSARYNLHRTYPEFLMQKGKLRIKDIKEILSDIAPEKKIIYDERYIEGLYKKYMHMEINDAIDKKRLLEEIGDKNILVLAPGKNILEEAEKIKKVIKEQKCIVLSVNFICDFVDSNYVFYSNYRRYVYEKRKEGNEKYIITSNLLRNKVKAEYVFNYLNLTEFGEYTCEDSVLMVLKLLLELNIDQIYVAGFDGFLGKEDHFDTGLDDFLICEDHSKYVKKILHSFFAEIKIKFVTSSYYVSENKEFE